jgi:hypothetical protein
MKSDFAVLLNLKFQKAQRAGAALPVNPSLGRYPTFKTLGY